jgi:hypothetical protein
VSHSAEPTRHQPVLLVGSGVVAAGLGDAVVALAERTRTGVLNTYCAKGLFAFDHPAHLGTVGLQHDDLVLASVTGPGATFAPVLAVGVAPGELPAGLPATARPVDPADLQTLELPVADTYPDRPALYAALAAVCGPLYVDDGTPLSPVRAAGDLSAWLPERTSVVAGVGLAGFWIGRTFPTRRPGTVWLPSRRDPDFVDRAVAQRTAAGDAVVVVHGPGDRGLSPGVGESGGAVVVEHWDPDGPRLDAASRVAQLDAAMDRARRDPQGTAHVHVGVRIHDLAAVEAVAGAVTAWNGGAAG